ncbi:MAG TPA: DoxX family protein [Pyrinomonadaceae bacterium]|nr:DoxX family protein [Pyrinomonadaceae bacterium]
MSFFERLLITTAPAATILVRFIVGPVFLSEGIQKFLYPDENGVGRFIKIGIPSPEMTAPFVGVVEIVCGMLLILGLLTRLAAIPLIINMLVAIVSTKIPILLGYEFLGFSLRKVSYYGFWGMAHEMRTDWAMLFGSIFLLIVGAGPLSLDAILAQRRRTRSG